MKIQPLVALKFIAFAMLLLAGNSGLFATCQNLIINGGFETGTMAGWITPPHGASNRTAETNYQHFHTGGYSAAAWLSGASAGAGEIEKMYQQVHIPSYGGTLSFWYEAQSFGTDFSGTGPPYATSNEKVYITDTNDSVLATVIAGSFISMDTFRHVTYNLAPFAGMTVRIVFQAQLFLSGDPFSCAATLIVDDITIDNIITTPALVHCALPINDTIRRYPGNNWVVYRQPGTYRDTLAGAASNGCDSIVITTIAYTPVRFTQTVPFCQATAISLTAGIHTYTTFGTYYDTLARGSVNGCDSIVTTNIIYLPVRAANPVTFCPNTSINLPVGNHIYTAAGTYIDTLAGAATSGCDSIVTTTVAYRPVNEIYQYLNFCGGGSVTINGHTYTVSGSSSAVYRDTLPGTSMYGCDSIVVTYISATPVPPSPSPVTGFTVSDGDSVNAINFAVAHDSLYAQWRGTTAAAGMGLRGARTLPAFRAVNNTNAPVIDTITVSARHRGYAYVAADRCILKFSLVQRQFVDTIYLPNNGGGAVQVLKSPAGNVAYIYAYGFAPGYGTTAKCIYVLDLVTDQIIRTINYTYPSISHSSAAADYAGTMTISPDGTTLYIAGNTGFDQGFSIVKLTIATGATSILSPQGVFDDAAHGMCITPDGRYLYVARYRNMPLKVDVATMTEVNTPRLSSITTASQVAVSLDGKKLYLADWVDRFYVVGTDNDSILYSANHVAGTVNYGAQGITLTPDSSNLLLLTGDIANYNLKAYKINITTNVMNQVLTNSGEAFSYHGGTPFPNISITPDGREFYLHYADFVFLQGASYAGGTSGNYGGAPALGQTMGFGSVGDMMVPGQCTSPEITFTITINPTMRYTQNINLCPGGSLTVAGHIHNATGTYVDTLVHGSVYGTDSIITTQLTVLPYPVSYQVISLCGGSLTVGSITHNTSGYYTDTLYAAAVNGCDSIVNTNLTINAPVAAPLATPNSQAVCAGGSVAQTVIDYPPGSGFHSIWTTTNAGIGLSAIGYDTVPAFVAINNGNTPVTETINLTKVFSGYAYVASGAVQRVTVIDRLTNTVVANINGIQGPTGLAVNADGSRVYVTSQGQDKITVIDGRTNTVITTINTGDQPNAVAVNKTGNRVYVCNYAAATVSVIDTVTNTVIATIPVGINPDGVAVNPNGRYVYVCNRGSNTVSVISTASNTVVATVNVAGLPFGVAVNSFGTLAYIANRGDSTLSVISTATNTVIDTIRVGNGPAGVAVSPDGSRLYASNYLDNTVSVINTATNAVTATIAVGARPQAVSVSEDGSKLYVVNSNGTTVSVVFTATNTISTAVTVPINNLAMGNFLSGSGCQSAAYSYGVTVIPSVRATQQVSLCTGNSITVGTHTYNTTGTYIDTLHGVAADGCDSIITTQLLMRNPVTSTVNATICNGSNYAGHTTAGTYVDHYSNIYGCDSARTLNLSVSPGVTSTVSTSICAGANYAGHTAAGTYIDHYTAVGGCDSARTLNLTVNEPVTSTVNASICNGSNYAGYTATGTYVDHYTGVNGCDSARTLNLTVNEPVTSTVNASICNGSNYAGYTATGTYVDHYTGVNGCDSARTLNLTVSQPVTSTITTAICQGANYAGHTTTGTFIDHYTGENGCDSARTLNLTVNEPVTSTVNASICNGSNYAGYTATGTYVDHYTGVNGCDSARTLNLTVSHPVTSTITTAICQGANYAGHTTTGTFIDHYTGENGCDSARTLNLTVNEPVTSTVNASICSGSNYAGYTATGTYVDHYTGVNGCDSARILNLAVNQPTSSITNVTVCASALPYSWNGLTFNAAGTQTKTGFTNSAGCDSSATLNLTVSTASGSTTNLSICSSQLPFSWNGLTFTAAGSQTATGFTNVAACDSSATLNLSVNSVVNSVTDLSICSSQLPYNWNDCYLPVQVRKLQRVLPM